MAIPASLLSMSYSGQFENADRPGGAVRPAQLDMRLHADGPQAALSA